MARVYLGLGSNIEPSKNLALGIRELRRLYGALDLSPVYRNEAVGFSGAAFLNMVVGLEAADTPEDMHRKIERIHELAGRQRRKDRDHSRSLDIDLLLYGDLIAEYPKFRLPRADVLEYGFVLRPLAELAPGLEHPQTGKSMAEHWRDFDAGGHILEPVDVEF